jgi:hypothetical protein
MWRKSRTKACVPSLHQHEEVFLGGRRKWQLRFDHRDRAADAECLGCPQSVHFPKQLELGLGRSRFTPFQHMEKPA